LDEILELVKEMLTAPPEDVDEQGAEEGEEGEEGEEEEGGAMEP